MRITNLPTSSSFASNDVLAIEVNGVTYKLTGATLAAAVKSIGDYVSSDDVVTTTTDGLMLSSDKVKLNGIAAGAQVNTITGVKGGAESSYRTGNVNLTKANLGISLDFAIYNSVTDLGLTSGNATILDAFNAMGNNTILICPAGEFAAAEVPNTYGTVEIVKPNVGGSRAYVRFYGKDSSYNDYRMFIAATSYNGNDQNKPTGYWQPEFTSFIGGRGADGVAVTGTALTVTFPKYSMHFLMLGSSSTSRAYVGLVNVSSSGSIGTIDLYKGSNVTLNTSVSQTLTLGINTSDVCSFICIPIRGNMYSGYSVT